MTTNCKTIIAGIATVLVAVLIGIGPLQSLVGTEGSVDQQFAKITAARLRANLPPQSERSERTCRIALLETIVAVGKEKGEEIGTSPANDAKLGALGDAMGTAEGNVLAMQHGHYCPG